MKSQSITYLLNASDHIYGILDLEDEVHSIWVIWTSNLQECKGNFIFWSQVERAGSMDFHPGSEGGVPGAGSTLGKCGLAQGLPKGVFKDQV